MFLKTILPMITSDEPVVKPNSRYTVMQTCAILCIDRKTLSRYTNEGWITCSYRKKPLRKFYVGSEIVRFWKTMI